MKLNKCHLCQLYLGSLVLERAFQRMQKHGGLQSPQSKDKRISCPPVIT